MGYPKGNQTLKRRPMLSPYSQSKGHATWHKVRPFATLKRGCPNLPVLSRESTRDLGMNQRIPLEGHHKGWFIGVIPSSTQNREKMGEGPRTVLTNRSPEVFAFNMESVFIGLSRRLSCSQFFQAQETSSCQA